MEWLGDIGGLYDALRLIGMVIVAPYSSFALKAELLSQVFRFTESKRLAEKREKQEKIGSIVKENSADSQDPPGTI